MIIVIIIILDHSTPALAYPLSHVIEDIGEGVAFLDGVTDYFGVDFDEESTNVV